MSSRRSARAGERHEHTDVLIVGGGPAGAAAALQLRRFGFRVTLVERSNYSDWRAGETLPPQSQILFRELGLWDRFRSNGFAASPAIRSCWGRSEAVETNHIFNPYGGGWHILRPQFDAMLVAAAEEAGVKVLQAATLRGARPSDGGWRAVIEANGASLEVSAAYLIDASGRSRWLMRARRQKWLLADQFLSLTKLFTSPPAHAAKENILILEAVEHGWWYAAPLPDETMVLTLITDAETVAASGLLPDAFWRCELERTREVGSCRHEDYFGSRLKSRVIPIGRLEVVAGACWAAVGDAASIGDPLAGAGICNAMQSGLQAAHALKDQRAGKKDALQKYGDIVSGDLEQHLKQREWFYRLEQRWNNVPFWQRRHNLLLAVQPGQPG